MQLINTRIISHPMNWAIVILMLIIGAMFGHLLLSFFEQEPKTGEKLPEGLSAEQLDTQLQGVSYMSSLASSQ